MGWGKGGKGFHGGKGWFHGPNPLLLGAEVALVGGAAAAVVACTAARPRRRPRPAPVVIVNSGNPSAVPGAPLPPQEIVYVYPGKGKGKGKGKCKAHWQVVTPLRVNSIRLPADAMEFRGDVNFFAIDVTSDSGATPSSWRIMRRYNDFMVLAERLGSLAYSFPDAPFPKKHICGCTGVKLENRRRGLEIWLQRVSEHPSSASVWMGPLRDFVGAVQVAYNPSAASMPTPSAPDPATLNSTPGKTAAQEPREPSEDECQELEIEVPPGVSVGQLVGVMVPGGKQLALPLPEGVKAGDTLVVAYDPAAGALRLLDDA